MNNELHLYFDDTGNRQPDRGHIPPRRDGMDCFGLGGILINSEDIPSVVALHKSFCQMWPDLCLADGKYAPLHSHKIRGRRQPYNWLLDAEKASRFYPALDEFMISLPVLGIAAIIHRPGYIERYAEKYAGKPWLWIKQLL